MLNALRIDTLAFSKKLREAGADEKLAEAFVEGITAMDTSDLATKSELRKAETALKSDIAEVKAELKSDIAQFRTELKSDIAEVRTELKSDIAEVRTELKWIKIIGGAILALLILPLLSSLIIGYIQ